MTAKFAGTMIDRSGGIRPGLTLAGRGVFLFLLFVSNVVPATLAQTMGVKYCFVCDLLYLSQLLTFYVFFFCTVSNLPSFKIGLWFMSIFFNHFCVKTVWRFEWIKLHFLTLIAELLGLWLICWRAFTELWLLITLYSVVLTLMYCIPPSRDRLEQLERQRERERKLREQQQKEQREQREQKERERRAEERRKERETRREGNISNFAAAFKK